MARRRSRTAGAELTAGSGAPGAGESENPPVRIDRWLWAARFFKTRGLAVEAVRGGHVEIDGARIKPSRDVRVGDRLEITRGRERFVVDVLGTSDRRGPAREAQRLYREDPDSKAERQRRAEEHRLSAPRFDADFGGRPDKRDRRKLRAAKRGR